MIAIFLACPTGYTEWQHSCYKLIKERFAWTEAAGYCSREGGKLVTIDTKTENAWLKQYLMKKGKFLFISL